MRPQLAALVVLAFGCDDPAPADPPRPGGPTQPTGPTSPTGPGCEGPADVLIVTGRAAPGFEDEGVVVDSLGLAPAQGGDGSVAVVAWLGGPGLPMGGQALYLFDPRGFATIVAEPGQELPGIGELLAVDGNVVVDDEGRVAFVAVGTAGRGVFAADRDGVWPVLFEGTSLDEAAMVIDRLPVFSGADRQAAWSDGLLLATVAVVDAYGFPGYAVVLTGGGATSVLAATGQTGGDGRGQWVVDPYQAEVQLGPWGHAWFLTPVARATGADPAYRQAVYELDTGGTSTPGTGTTTWTASGSVPLVSVVDGEGALRSLHVVADDLPGWVHELTGRDDLVASPGLADDAGAWTGDVGGFAVAGEEALVLAEVGTAWTLLGGREGWTTLAEEGRPAPGLTATLTALDVAHLAPDGAVVLRGRFDDGGLERAGLWAGDGTGVDPVLLAGDTVEVGADCVAYEVDDLAILEDLVPGEEFEHQVHGGLTGGTPTGTGPTHVAVHLTLVDPYRVVEAIARVPHARP